MALRETGIDFSGEDWDAPTRFFDGCWVVASKHTPAMNTTMEVNNRTFVFRVKNNQGEEVLVVFGCSGATVIDAVKQIEKQTGLKVAWVISNGGAHHMFLELWYEAFPDARIPIPAKRIPSTRNGQALQKKYAHRWELLEGPRPTDVLEEIGDEIDIAIFDQLFMYKDATAAIAFNGGAQDHKSEPTSYGGFAMMKAFGSLTKDTSQPNDEVTFFHKPSGLVIAGHNCPFSYVPKGYKPPKKFEMKPGPFPINVMMKMMMKPHVFRSMLDGMPAPVADSKIHAETWDMVLGWPIKAWTTAHDPPTVCGPDLSGDEIKALMRESIKRSGEDDQTGASLTWNVKNK